MKLGDFQLILFSEALTNIKIVFTIKDEQKKENTHLTWNDLSGHVRLGGSCEPASPSFSIFNDII